jgi:glucokinase
MNDYVVGIDLGATKIALGLIDPADRIVAYRRIATNAIEGPQAAVERMAGSIADLKSELPSNERIVAVAVCSPGPLHHERGVIVDPPNLPGWRNVPLRQMLSDRLNLPVTLEHDAKAAALGEYYYGVGRGERSLAYIVVGTGTGAAFILDGQLYRGLHNSAGEIGGVTIDRHAERYGQLCGSGIRGCVQGYTCGPALAYHYEQLRARAEGRASGKDEAPITGEQVAQLARQGDELACQVLTQAGEALGVIVGSLAMILDIDLYVIGGSVVKAGDLLLEPARQNVPNYTFASVASHVRIVAAGLGDDGPILGCGWLARQSLLT